MQYMHCVYIIFPIFAIDFVVTVAVVDFVARQWFRQFCRIFFAPPQQIIFARSWRGDEHNETEMWIHYQQQIP